MIITTHLATLLLWVILLPVKFEKTCSIVDAIWCVLII